MLSRLRVLSIVFVFALGSFGHAGDKIVNYESDDQAMNAAIEEARVTLPKFLKKLSDNPKEFQGASLKVAFPASPNSENIENEIIWVSEFHSPDGKRFHGYLANEPNHLENLTLGSPVTFERDQITDWSVLIGGQGYGYYTIRVMMPKLSKGERKQLKAFFSPEPLPKGW